MLQTVGMAFKASVVALARQGLFFLPAVALLPLIFGLFGVQTAQTAADFLAFALALPMGLSVLNKFREDVPENSRTTQKETRRDVPSSRGTSRRVFCYCGVRRSKPVSPRLRQ